MSERLHVVGRGEESGRKNSPPFTALQPDRVEVEIAELTQQEYARAVDIYRQGLENYDRRIYGISLETLGVEIRGAGQAAIAEYTFLAHKAQDEISLDRRDLDEVEQELDNFRASNKLTRGCRIPEGHITHIRIVLLVLLVDTLANGYLLSSQDEFGWLGGMLQAIIVAGLNVSLGFAAGRIALPNIVHQSMLRRIGGLAVLAIILCLILGLNLSFAHYRDLSVLGTANPGERALSDVLTTPMVLHDVKSWWLACIGVLFAFVSLLDGFKWDDPYPGYGELTRRRAAEREKYLDRKHYWLELIKEKREQARAEVGDIRHGIDVIQGEITQASTGRRGFISGFLAHVMHLEAAANQLMEMYREANRRVRTTPAPPHFEERWQLTRTEIPVPSEIERDHLRRQVQGITASLSDALSKIHEMHDETIHAFDRLDSRGSTLPDSAQRIRLVG
jgi:hypothetical protein